MIKKKIKKNGNSEGKLTLNLNFGGGSISGIPSIKTPKLTTHIPSGIDPTDNSKGKFNVNKLLNKILKSELGVPLDIKIDDSSMPVAPNFVTFLNSPEFLNVRAFSRQNEIGTKLFGEWCPRCSDVEWMENIPVDCSLKRFKRKVTLLEFGICPKCGIGRAEFMKLEELPAYQEGAVACGQRSAKSHVTAMIAAYLLHRYLKLQNPVQLLGLVQATMLHGTFVALTYAQAKDTLWEPFSEYISNSPWYCLAKGTEISMADGSKTRIEEIKIGDRVKTLEGINDVLNIYNNGVKECFDLNLSNGKVLTGTQEHKIRCFDTTTNSLIWKSIGEIEEGDLVVSE